MTRIRTALGAACAAALTFAAAAFTPAFAAKDSLVLGMVLEPPGLDPTNGAAAATDEVVYANVFEGLVRIDRNAEVRPALAESWTVSEDGKTLTFALRTGVAFHDGSAFDAEDAAFSLNRIIAEDSANSARPKFEAMESAVAVDAATLKVTLKHPDGAILETLALGDAVMVAPESVDGNGSHPVGTGPFIFESWTKGDKVVLARNPNYWGEPVALATATFRFISDGAAAIAAMLSGDVDAFANFPGAASLAQFEADPRFNVVVGATEGETILATNNGRKPFDDLRVRQAIAHAIDRKALIDGATYGYATPIGTHFSPAHPAYLSELIDTYPYDVEKAKALLAEAGYPDGFEARLVLPPPPYARDGGEIIAAQLKEIGVNCRIEKVEWAQWLDAVYKNKDYDLTIVSHTEPLDIGIYARGHDYYFDYVNPEVVELNDELNETLDPARRMELMGAMQTAISKDAVNGYLFQLPKYGVWNAKIEGLWENSPIQANDLTEVRWVE